VFIYTNYLTLFTKPNLAVSVIFIPNPLILVSCY